MFLKIFLWFWLAIALLVGVLVAITAATANNEPTVRMRLVVANEAMDIYAVAAADAFERAGKTGLQSQLQEIAANSDVRVTILDSDLNVLASNADLPEARGFVEKAVSSNDTVLDITPEGAIAARKIETSSGQNLFLIAQVRRPRSTNAPAVEQQTLVLRILGVVLAAGLVCYALARYLTSPLDKLRLATKTLASGDLSVRVANKIGKRRDEISSLARDFDEMATRIENLLAAQKNLTTDISHELRSPLARLGVALEIARSKANPEAQPALDRIERESFRLNEMIHHLLLLSKLEAGAQSIEKARIDLSNVVAETIADADFEARAQGKTVKLIENESCFVSGDKQLLRSAIENVVRNAVRHTPENESVEVSLRKTNGSARITVRDFGAGVSEADLDKLFRPFFRVGFARERSAGGFGLGLAITARAVSAHGGTVTAQNHPNNGLVVEIMLDGDK